MRGGQYLSDNLKMKGVAAKVAAAVTVTLRLALPEPLAVAGCDCDNYAIMS